MRKNNKHYPLIYARYIFPLVANLLIVIFFYFRNIRFILDTDIRQRMSLADLIENTWVNSRMYLFSANAEQTGEGVVFYRAVFAMLIVCIVLFIIGVAMNIFAAIAAGSYYIRGEQKLKNIYISIVPNRFVMLVFSLFLLPITFFPEILVYLYRHLLVYNVKVEYTGVSAGILSVIVMVVLIVITILSRKREILQNRNIFIYNLEKTDKKKKDSELDDQAEATSEKHYSIRQPKADDAEKLKDLLGLSDDEDEENNE